MELFTRFTFFLCEMKTIARSNPQAGQREREIEDASAFPPQGFYSVKEADFSRNKGHERAWRDEVVMTVCHPTKSRAEHY